MGSEMCIRDRARTRASLTAKTADCRLSVRRVYRLARACGCCSRSVSFAGTLKTLKGFTSKQVPFERQRREIFRNEAKRVHVEPSRTVTIPASWQQTTAGTATTVDRRSSVSRKIRACAAPTRSRQPVNPPHAQSTVRGLSRAARTRNGACARLPHWDWSYPGQ